jgi:molybdate transport system ATP-binding protein
MLDVAARLRRGNFELEAKFTAPTPGVTALFGRSGCGKTTLINIIAGLVDARAAYVDLDGCTWVDSSRALRIPAEQRRIGYVFQDARLFPHFTVRGNLLYGARRAPAPLPPDKFDDVVSLLGLAPLLARRPAQLSGGEKQRVALGRALLSQPRLLLLDEPLASLDAARREEILPYLERLRDNYAIPMVFVSHQFDDVLRLATHLVVMDAGRVTAAGDVGTVSLSPALQDIVGPDALGAVVEGAVIAVDAGSDLAEIAVGAGRLHVPAQSLRPGQVLRAQLFARDVIIALSEPHGLSVRNRLRGEIVAVTATGMSDLVEIDVGGVIVLSRVTRAATRELDLRPGLAVWVLVKAVSVSAHLGAK